MPPLTVTEAVAQRKSCRAFLSRAPPIGEIRELLALASRAPSGANMQPWRAYVVSGGARDGLVARIQSLLDAGEAPADSDEFAVYPTREALAQKRDMRDRRRKLGLDMYRLLGITKGDTDGILAALKRNYSFFDAPVGIIITVDKAGDRNFFGHVGSFLQTFCLLACERGIATCLQEAWSQFDEPVADELGIDREREAIWCGIAVGYEDPSKPVNRLVTDRAPPEEFATFFDAPRARL